MWRLAQEGARAPEGGVTSLPSSTDPGFCSLLTGQLPERHDVRTTAWRFADLPDWAGSRAPSVPTIFDRLAGAGLRTTAVMGDDRGLLCTGAASFRWPPDDRIPVGVPLDAHGYPANAAVRPHLLKAAEERATPFVFGHINEADTVGHDLGPESEAAASCYGQTDGLVGEVLDALQPGWSDTVIIIVSDHDMEARTPTPPIDVTADPRFAELSDGVIPDGGAALVHLRPGITQERAGDVLARVNGVASWQAGGPELLILGAKAGHIFAAPRHPAGGFHGGPTTARTVAIVGGGHPAVPGIASRIAHARPHLSSWAAVILDLLEVQTSAQVSSDQPRRIV
jgi:arylsulfatase A-like enzyme